MEITIASQTDVGRARSNNEDSFFVDAELGLYVVCDGMGGHNAGEIASGLACEVLQKEISGAQKAREKFLLSGSAEDAESLRKVVEAAVSAASREIYRRAGRDNALAGMGTTCTMLLLCGHDKAILGHVGDSRLYVARNGRVHQLTLDHTYVNELMRRGSLTREQARHHPQSNVLSRALGVQPSVAAETMVFDIDPADVYLLCSDGLHNYFPNTQELGPVLVRPDLQQGLGTLIKTALERGGHDNITAIAVRVGPAADSERTLTAADRRITMLKRIVLFSHLSYNELVRVVGLTRTAQATAGQTIVREGDGGSELYVTLSGEVEVEKGGNVVAALKAGSHFGEMAMIDSAPRSATVRACTDVNLLVMHRAEFFALIRSEPVIAAKLLWSFLQVLSERLRNTTTALHDARGATPPSEDFEVLFADDESIS